MPAYLPDVLDRAAATCPDADRPSLERTVREVIAACGWDVAANGEVYNPAEGAYKRAPMRSMSSAPRQQNVHWRGGRRP